MAKTITKSPKPAKKTQKNVVLGKKGKITSVKRGQKLGRNTDGTFAKGNQESVGNKGGRPPVDYSARAIAKAKAPEKMNAIIDKLYELAETGDVNAIDKVIKLNGNYDASETKDVTPTKTERPLKDFNKAELKKLLRGAK